MRIKKYFLFFFLGYWSFVGVLKICERMLFFKFWKYLFFNIRILFLNFKIVFCLKDWRVFRVYLVLWFLSIFFVDWLFLFCIWFFFLCDLKKGLNWNVRSFCNRYLEVFRGEFFDIDLIFFLFIWLRKIKWGKVGRWF